MVVQLILKTEINFKQEKMLKFTQFWNFQRCLRKISFLKIAAQAFDARDFLIIFLMC